LLYQIQITDLPQESNEIMTIYIRFSHLGTIGAGMLEGSAIKVCSADLFAGPVATGQTLKLSEVELLPPCEPEKFLALWNNFYARAEKEGWDIPPEPLYFVKTANSWNTHGRPIRRPKSYHGKVVFEAELGIVIGKRCRAISEHEAKEHIFGYTCVNDVTAKDILFSDRSFPQWTRAKGFDSFGVFGPGIVTGVEPDNLVVQAILDGELKQNYPVSDMIFGPHRLVSLISQDITLEPGDIIACGTALGAAAMQDGQTIEIKIAGVGSLINIMSRV
jgi:2-keto-4-pentenoate hydratase/2-oxohepta-3-ene-1,7-dioic acid hydratase in catechol pathway